MSPTAQPQAAVESAVKANLTPKRRRSEVETTGPRGYMNAARRFILAAGRRAGDGDEHELAELIALRDTLDEAVALAVAGQRAYGKSWAAIARGTGTTREAAWQRWGRGK